MPENDTSRVQPAEPQSAARSKVVLWCILVVLLSATVLIGIQTGKFRGDVEPSDPQLRPEMDRRLPKLQLKSAEEGNLISTDDLRGKVLVIHLWGPWCTPCRVEMPALHRLYQAHRDRHDFELLSVTCGPDLANENLGALVLESQNYLRERDFNFPLLVDDSGNARRELLRWIDPSATRIVYPLTLLVDRQGVVRRVWVGGDSLTEELGRELERELAGGGRS